MDATFGMIPAGSEQQAMDWSLVLVSQGIDTFIERDGEAGHWQLVVRSPDYERAVQALWSYRQENRRRPWVRELPATGLIFDWRCLGWVVALLVVFAYETSGHGRLSEAGMVDQHAVRGGQWWRLFTAVTLHRDVPHLAANLTTGFVLVGLAMGTLGPGLGLLGAFLAGVGGNVAGLFLYPETHRSLGASGMVLGALGLLTAQSLALLREGVSGRQLARRGVLSGCLLLVLLGLSPAPNVDLVAHVGGFGAGLVIGGVFAFLPTALSRSALGNAGAVALCFGAALGCWWLALRAGRL